MENLKILNTEYILKRNSKYSTKCRKIPTHQQEAVKTEIKKLIESGHIGKIQELGEDFWVGPAVIARKSDPMRKFEAHGKPTEPTKAH